MDFTPKLAGGATLAVILKATVSLFAGSVEVPLASKLSTEQQAAFTARYPYATVCLTEVHVSSNITTVEGDTKQALETCITRQSVLQTESLKRTWGAY